MTRKQGLLLMTVRNPHKRFFSDLHVMQLLAAGKTVTVLKNGALKTYKTIEEYNDTKRT